jgi:hypothetical protein
LENSSSTTMPISSSFSNNPPPPSCFLSLAIDISLSASSGLGLRLGREGVAACAALDQALPVWEEEVLVCTPPRPRGKRRRTATTAELLKPWAIVVVGGGSLVACR